MFLPQSFDSSVKIRTTGILKIGGIIVIVPDTVISFFLLDSLCFLDFKLVPCLNVVFLLLSDPRHVNFG